MDDQPVSAYRESLSERATRWMRRHRTLMTGVSAAVLAGLLGLACVSVVQVRATLELTQAHQVQSDALVAEIEARRQTKLALRESKKARKEVESVLMLAKDSVFATATPPLRASSAYTGALDYRILQNLILIKRERLGPDHPQDARVAGQGRPVLRRPQVRGRIRAAARGRGCVRQGHPGQEQSHDSLGHGAPGAVLRMRGPVR